MNPAMMGFERWVAEVSIVADISGYITSSPRADRWREAARQISDAPTFRSLSIPDPMRYGDWVSWAVAFQDAARQFL